MENIGEMSDQQSVEPNSVSVGGEENNVVTTVAPQQDEAVTNSDLIGAHDLSPSISQSEAVSVSVSSNNMIDSTDYRSPMTSMCPDSYQALNGGGRLSPGYNASPSSNTYATLTPLQPLPPISTVSDKFAHGASPNVSGSFTLMQNNVGVDMNSAYRYDHTKLGGMGVNMGVSPTLGTTPMSMGTIGTSYGGNGYAQPQAPLSSYPAPGTGYGSPQNGLHSPKQEPKVHMSPNSFGYDSYSRGFGSPPSSRLHSPNAMMPTTLNGLHANPVSPHSHHHLGGHRLDRPPSSTDSQGSKQGELEEINTKELAQKISSELKRYSIPQAVFAQRVLCRSQGTLSDLLRNPKPWSKLKSGRETFRRMWKWLQEPEFQRMSALRLAGMSTCYFSLLLCIFSSQVILLNILFSLSLASHGRLCFKCRRNKIFILVLIILSLKCSGMSE